VTTVLANDAPPVSVQFTVQTSSVTEGAGRVVLSVSRVGATTAP
jgi:hypothetical protein